MLALAALLAGCTGTPPARDGPKPWDVDAPDFAFEPQNLTVEVGRTVVWKNTGATVHTVTADVEGMAPLDSGDVRPGHTYTFTFLEPGTYPYHCRPHAGKGEDGRYAGMVGAIIVEP